LALTDASLGRRVAAASESHVAQAAREVLAKGNAIDAVVAGVLMAAAESPSVLLGPVQLLAGGGGAGLVAIDGRVRQPGLGAPRPRGFLPDEPVPEAAYFGVPALAAALAAALGTLGSVSALRVAGPALAAARSRSPERAGVIEAIARRGAPALAEDAIAGELTAAGGRAARGLLTPEDLAAVRPVLSRCDERSLGPSGILRAPWRGEESGAPDGSMSHVIAAVDGRGLVAIACYEATIEGVPVPALGLIAPRAAAPVLRGTPRIAPGDPRPAAAPIVLRSVRGITELALGVAIAADAEALLASVLESVDAVPAFIEALRSASSGRCVAIATTRETARVLASA
jgi:gamma-glutamyltranspeptidase/glutathione hydrolase